MSISKKRSARYLTGMVLMLSLLLSLIVLPVRSTYAAGAGSVHALTHLRAPVRAQTPAPAAATLKANGRIAFKKNNSEGLPAIYTMNADGSDQRKLVSGSNNGGPNFTAYSDPAWSPDGTKLAFDEVISTNSTLEEQIGVMNADGSNQVLLTDTHDPPTNGLPAWSPDGLQIAFIRGHSETENGFIVGFYAIYVMNADGSNVRKLTDDLAENTSPSWSPDGTRIAFTHDDHGRGDVYVMNADGSNQRNLTNNGRYHYNTAWSPDGSRIAFSSVRTGNYEIYVMNVDGSNQTRLTTASGSLHPTWSPDGTKIAFASARTGDYAIYVMNADGSNQTQITAGTMTEFRPAWQPLPVQSSGNPIDDAQFFARQHYRDFLNREPDAGGLAYWTNQITGCGADAACINSRRIGVSAAFFIETEFQETGSFIYRLYKASYGTRPTFAQFMGDRSLVVADSNLEASKQAFADNWVQRAAFLQAYPASMTPEDFVSKLMDTAGLKPYLIERQQEVQALSANTKTRAQVLRDVIEFNEFKAREYNLAFVLMQYFGYLRREPEQAGYDFWLNVLNNHLPRDASGYRSMVCAFITSREFQERFGSTVTRSNADCAP